MEDKRPLQSIPDDELLHRLADLMGQSRRVEADIVAHIAEVEERRLYAREAFPSMFVYCMDVLHLSEAEAYLRIAAARASRKHPMLLTMLADGRLHLTAIKELAPHLTLENRDGLLEQATHRSKRQILELIAAIAPRPDVPAVVRRLPERRALPAAGLLAVPTRESPLLGLAPDGVAAREREPGAVHNEAALSHPEWLVGARASAASAPPVSRSVVQPLSPGRYKVQFTASAEFHDKLERLTALMASRRPDCDLATVIEQAVTEKLERLEDKCFAHTKAPRKTIGGVDSQAATGTAKGLDLSPSSRHIPAAVRRAVRQRDGDQCRYVNEQGRRCPERYGLEFHHRRPFGLGGGHGVANIGLLCRAHNGYMAELDYGREAIARRRLPRRRASQPAAG